MDKIYELSEDKLLEIMKTRKEGLSNDEAMKKLSFYGRNVLEEEKNKHSCIIFLSQFRDLLVIILFIAAIIAFFSNNIESTIVIFIVLILNALLGTIQEIKAEQSLKSLRNLSMPKVKVLRSGLQVEILCEEIVPGDVVMLEAGDLVCADGRLIDNFSLQVNESALTGEAEPVNKVLKLLHTEELSLGDQKNMVFSGSLVTYGRGSMVVTQTGMETEIGKIAALISNAKKRVTPLQESLDQFSKRLAGIILIICIGVCLLGIYREMPVLDALMFAVALAVAAIPEALSSIVTIVMALGTERMVKQNAIIKNLKAVETLGCTSIICSDKTGTLTQNRMTVTRLFRRGEIVKSTDLQLENHVDDYLLKACLLCNDSITRDGKEIGDPTEVALVNFGDLYKVDEEALRKQFKRQGEIAFDSERKLMTTLYSIEDKNILFTKGAIDVLVDRLTHIYSEQGISPINSKDLNSIIETAETFSKEGLRVLAFAYKVIDELRELRSEDEADYIFLGLIGMIDPPRETSKEAVEICHKAGIKPIMITGDHRVTATTIAEEIGIFHEGDLCIEGIELDNMTDEMLEAQLENITVYARVAPVHKIRIVEAFQKQGKVVAMTGDGVNDGPALKSADIGIAMGKTGTEVAKDAADMILADDNFITIIKAVANGRNVYSNIKNAIHFLLSGNTAGILCVLYTSLLALPLPFKPVQLLFMNLVTDSLPAIGIGVEGERDHLLLQPPRNHKEKLLNKRFLRTLLEEGVFLGVFTMIAFFIGLQESSEEAATMAFATLCLARLIHGFNCRDERHIWEIKLFSNKAVVLAFVIGFILLHIVLFIPGIKAVFEIAALSLKQLMTIYILAFLPNICIQLTKHCNK